MVYVKPVINFIFLYIVMRQKETTKLNVIMNKLWLPRGTELNNKLYNQTLLMLWISPFDITSLDEELTSKWLLKEWVSLSDYCKGKLNDDEYKSFLILFWLE